MSTFDLTELHTEAPVLVVRGALGSVDVHSDYEGDDRAVDDRVGGGLVVAVESPPAEPAHTLYVGRSGRGLRTETEDWVRLERILTIQEASPY